MEGIYLRFTDKALAAVAREAIRKKTGARGLRAVMEHYMLEIMYELPSLPSVTECIVNENVIAGNAPPRLIFQAQKSLA